MDTPSYPFSRLNSKASVTSTSSADLASSPFKKQIFSSEADMPLFLSHKEGSKLYKKLVLTNKNKTNESIHYPKDSLEDVNNNQLEVLYCVKKDESPRIFVFDSHFSLGRGTQGFVCLGQEIFKDKNIKSNMMVAVKISKLSTDRSRQDFKNEQLMLSKQNRFRGDVIEKNPLNNTGYLVQDFCYGRTFFDWCYKKIAYNKTTKQYVYERILFDSLLKKRIVTAIINAYHVLHQEYGILHRDIKPENIMINVTPENIVTATIIDFSTSCLVQNSEKTFSGTPGYVPEEASKPLSERPFYSVQTEYWSIATICAAWLSQFNYLTHLDKKMLLAKQLDGFMPQYSQLDLYKALPDIFNTKRPQSLPHQSKRSLSSSSSYSYASMSWDEFLLESIRWLARENVNLRPASFEVTKMLEHLSLYECNDKLEYEDIDPILIEKMTISPPITSISFKKLPKEKETLQRDPSLIKSDSSATQVLREKSTPSIFSPRRNKRILHASADTEPNSNLAKKREHKKSQRSSLLAKNDANLDIILVEKNNAPPYILNTNKTIEENNTDDTNPELTPIKKEESKSVIKKR